MERFEYMKKILGILGGMGPLATADLFKKVVLLTEAEQDQDHIYILVDSNPSIPDRTSFILGKGENPLNYLVESAKKLESMKANCIIMPCNTAHYFYNDIIKEINIPFLNMIEETAKEIKDLFPNVKKAGLLATEGTCITGVYDNFFKKFNLEPIMPDNEHQRYITNLIESIKKSSYNIDISGIYKTIELLKSRGAELFVLGCTELPIAFEIFNIKEKVVDPTSILAKAAIKFMGKKIKG